MESDSWVRMEEECGFRELLALETPLNSSNRIVLALYSLCGVNLDHSVCSDPAGLMEDWSEPGIPEGQLDVC